MKVKSTGFTLIELLVSMSILIILVGTVVAVINPVSQRRKTRDALRFSNLEKVITGIEAYGSVTGTYPDSGGSDTLNPLLTDPTLATYIKLWPNDEPSSGTEYYYYATSDKQTFGVSVAQELDHEFCYKYRSDWSSPKIRECKNSGSYCMPSEAGEEACK
jgi:type II secretory pathway pseudopilin PulG